MNKVEKSILSILPVLAPTPTGYIVFMAFLDRQWWWPAALVTALALEILGYYSARLVMAVSEHNRTLSAVEKSFEISVWRAWLPVLAYAVIALTLTFFLKMFPALFVWSFLSFPFVGLLSAWVTAEYRVLDDHAAAKSKARQEAKEKREQEKKDKQLAQAAAQVAEQEKQVAPATPQVVDNETRKRIDRQQLVSNLRTNPGISNKELAELFGVSAEAVRLARKKVTPSELGLAQKGQPQ